LQGHKCSLNKQKNNKLLRADLKAVLAGDQAREAILESRERDRERHTERDRERDRERQRERDRQTETESVK
jgi:Ni/Co efflux regulator RcnB